jgi:hypothetical protein
MQTKKILTFTAVAATLVFSACKKDNSNNGILDEFETTFEMSSDQAIAYNLTEDASDVFNEAAADNNLMGGRTTGELDETTTQGLLGCATTTVTPQNGFPKTIVIDFGNGCTSPNGITRKGKISVVLSDSLRKPNSTSVMTFDNYFVNGFKKEGTITWTNTSTPGTRSWQRKVENGKITAPSGKFWLHSGTKNVTQTAGIATPNILIDDVFSITGSHSVTNTAGKTRNSTILEALQKKTACENIDKGKVKVQGPNHFAVIDFGDGACDRLATISIDGRPARTILLR